MSFLIKTGILGFIISFAPMEKVTPNYTYGIKAANGNPTAMYVRQYLLLDLGLGEVFLWNFLVADVTILIIGTDFLTYFNFNVDLKHRKLVRNLFYPTALVTGAQTFCFNFLPF